ncbi:MAG TPA: hypothetical protein DCY88_22155 [Cyanobacteria bacterium UBA11372]|nr:hypothetical protein [Cyanobacteria bacterium UBA11372]
MSNEEMAEISLDARVYTKLEKFAKARGITMEDALIELLGSHKAPKTKAKPKGFTPTKRR